MGTLSSSKAAAPPSLRSIRRGVQIFLIFTLLGLMVAYLWKAPRNIAAIFRHSSTLWLASALPLLGLDFVLGGLRYRLFFNGRTLPQISLWDCMRSNWANLFMGVITPFQTGGGPAQIFILWRCGATVAQAALVSLINFGATLIFFQIATAAAVVLLPQNLFSPSFTAVMKTGFLVVFTVTTLVVLLLIFPGTAMTGFQRFSGVLPQPFGRLRALVDRLLHFLQRQVEAFAIDFQRVLRQERKTILLTALATVGLFSNKFLIGYVLARSLNSSVPFAPFIGIQSVQLFLIYFAPTPGASGIAEFSSAWLMQALLPADVLLMFTLAWRFFTTFLGAVFGSVVLLLEIRRTLAEGTSTASI